MMDFLIWNNGFSVNICDFPFTLIVNIMFIENVT